MRDDGTILDAVRAALRSEARIDLHHYAPRPGHAEASILLIDGGPASADAGRPAPKKSAFVTAGQIGVCTRGYAVTPDGLVPAEAEKDMAEREASYGFGVDTVLNRPVVRS
jgi:hypothetical protein